MAFPKIDCYIEVDIVNDPRFSTQNANLILPLSIQQRNDIFVALTYMVYEHSTRLYDNVKLAIFDFGMPKLTTVQVPDPNPDPDPGPDPGPGFRFRNELCPGVYKTVPKVEMIRCQLENAEHDGKSLCNALNEELKHKLSSQFDPDSCKFIWNKDIARAEISIDGSESIPADSRATLILFYPLSFHLGFTRTQAPGASYAFGAPLKGYVKPDQIVKKSHAIAGYVPHLAHPQFINIFLEELEQQVFIDALFFKFFALSSCDSFFSNILLCHSVTHFSVIFFFL